MSCINRNRNRTPAVILQTRVVFVETGSLSSRQARARARVSYRAQVTTRPRIPEIFGARGHLRTAAAGEIFSGAALLDGNGKGGMKKKKTAARQKTRGEETRGGAHCARARARESNGREDAARRRRDKKRQCRSCKGHRASTKDTRAKKK